MANAPLAVCRVRSDHGLLLLALALLGGCGEETGGSAPVPELPRFGERPLDIGRAVWMQACRNCHLTGLDGAAPITDPTPLAAYLERGRAALQRSVIEGLHDAEGRLIMPPRSGLPRLTGHETNPVPMHHSGLT